MRRHQDQIIPRSEPLRASPPQTSAVGDNVFLSIPISLSPSRQSTPPSSSFSQIVSTPKTSETPVAVTGFRQSTRIRKPVVKLNL